MSEQFFFVSRIMIKIKSITRPTKKYYPMTSCGLVFNGGSDRILALSPFGIVYEYQGCGDRIIPRKIEFLDRPLREKIIDISVDSSFVHALSDQNRIYSLGAGGLFLPNSTQNTLNKFECTTGNPHPLTIDPVIKGIPVNGRMIRISSGRRHSAVLVERDDNTRFIITWGCNNEGKLGDANINVNVIDENTIENINGRFTFKNVVCKNDYTLASGYRYDPVSRTRSLDEEVFLWGATDESLGAGHKDLRIEGGLVQNPTPEIRQLLDERNKYSFDHTHSNRRYVLLEDLSLIKGY